MIQPSVKPAATGLAIAACVIAYAIASPVARAQKPPAAPPVAPPTTVTAMHGLHFRFVKDGVFDRGGTATNRVEARAVAEAVVEHARRYPRQSLGVGAFSVAQRDAIRNELEVLQREHVDLAPFAPGRLRRMACRSSCFSFAGKGIDSMKSGSIFQVFSRTANSSWLRLRSASKRLRRLSEL